METTDFNYPQIDIVPSPIFAVLKVIPLVLLSSILLCGAWLLFPSFIWLSLLTMCFACYRFRYIRKSLYQVGPQVIRIKRGIFYKRTDIVEMYRIRDYVLTQPFFFQLFQLMNLTLKTTDAENPVIWMRGIPRSDLLETIRNYVQEARKTNNLVEIN